MKNVICRLIPLLLIGASVLGQGRLTPPELRLTYEGYEVTPQEGMYIPKEGFFQLDLANQQEVDAQLPEDAYLSFISSEARLVKPNDTAPLSMTSDHAFLDSDLDLMPILRHAAARDHLELEVKYVYVSRRSNGKTKVLKEGTSRLTVPLK